MTNDGKKCSSKAICLTLFFLFQVFGFTLSFIAVLFPTWQFVYLEDGRTEHHHGLWLDCKRDYSNEYGRPKEYYEKLYRLDFMQGPFDQFSLPSLQCVYKFDYWIDEEDLYEHGYDENRLEGDGYQHLFLGWKIAALTALTFSLICSLSSLIICVCAFCHRLLICVSTVIATISGLTAMIGNTVFFMYARYQDNNIIKEDDGLYEQYFGWCFYFSVVGNFFLICAAVLGCVTTAIAMSLGKAKLVKIEVDDNDSHQLLSSGSSDQPFKRSFSAVYKIDSAALRKWEREAMKSYRKKNFKRANSMPNIKKGTSKPARLPSFMHSTSDISKAFTDPANFVSGPMQRRSLTASETQIMETYASINPHGGGNAFPADANDPVYPPPLQNPEDVVYEYVDHNSISLSSSVKMDTLQNRSSPSKNGTAINVYDKVAGTPNTSLSSQHRLDDDEYLRPISGTRIPAYTSIEKPKYDCAANGKTTSFGSSPGHRRMPSEDFRHSPIITRGKSTLITPISTFTPVLKPLPPEVPEKPAFLRAKTTDSGSKASSIQNEPIVINTFNHGRGDSAGHSRSLVSLSQTVGNEPINNFDRSTTATPSSPASSSDYYGTSGKSLSNKLLHQVLLSNAGVKETNIDWPSLPRKPGSRNSSDVSTISKTDSYAPSEMDRSIGSSTIVLPNSPSQQYYDHDYDRSSTSTTKNQDDETVV